MTDPTEKFLEYMDSNKYIEHLVTQLEEQHRSLWREKLAVARLQREVAQRRSEGAMHEKLIHELEEERHLRLQSEKRLQEVTLESERNRIQMRGLQQQFSRMEETVRNLLQSQGPTEQKKEETVSIMVYQEKLSEDERKHKEALEDLHMVVDEDSRSESSSADEGKGKTKLLLERLKALEAENSALALENENQREQYERCLDEVANQVVQALLTQKDLREECVKLKTRVFDLEQQNRTLSILFQQRVRPTSDLLLQKLHSRILDLSSGDLLSEMERSRSPTRSQTDVEIHECQLNAKSRTPALTCPGLGVVIPGHLCSRNSCSSSELSLSSTCSEYSSGSSYTWHEGKNLTQRQSSQNWDKRLSIDSSLPSGFASPTDELPPTRIKESHILEGLRKLQKRKVLLEPPSVITKWGYKDCMNSNEGIYSPGIKSSSLKESPSCKPADTGSPCKEPHKTFVYDTDSHDDADEDPSSLALIQAVPNQARRLHACKLTHSVSDSLFGWELNGKHFSEGATSVYSRERPEKLSSCASNYPLERKLCPSVQAPQVQRERGPHSQSHLALNLQLSDTDDNETLDELHIDSSDEKSPSDLSLTADTDKSTENLDVLMKLGKSQLGTPHQEERRASIHLESRPKTFSFIKQQRVVKRTSSEECITVIFDAGDGEPIEFSSHQAGVVTVTKNEISINQAPTGPKAEHIEHLPQGIAHLQPRAVARDYAFLKRPEEETEKNIPQDGADIVAEVPTESFSSRAVTQNTQQQKLAKPTHIVSCQSNSRSSVSMGIYPKQGLTKIPARGKSSPQKSKTMELETSTSVPSSGPVTLEKSPGLAPGKLSRFRKTESPAYLFDIQADSHIPKHPTQLPHGSKMSSRRDWVQCPKSQIPASQLLSRPLTKPSDDGEPLTRDKHCDPGPDAGLKSPSPPPPPGRSVSLLIRPTYDYLPPPSSAKPETRVLSETARTVFKSPPLKGSSAPIISSNQTMTEVQGKKPVAFKKPIFTHPLPSTETAIQTRCSARTPSSSVVMMAPGPSKVSPKRGVPKIPSHQSLGTTQTDTGLRTSKNCPSTHGPLEIPSSKTVTPGRKGQLNDSISTTPKPSFLGVKDSPSSQVNSPSSSPSSKSHNAPHGCQNAHEKGLKTRLPVGLKVLMKSPQLLRKSSTVPGKHEKDSLNEASKSSVAANKSKPEHSRNLTSSETTAAERHVTPLGSQAQDSLAEGFPLEAAMPESLENRIPGAEGKDGIENRSVKRSLSSNKPHLKPALGMNGAKARSQSFSAHSGDKPPTPPVEGPGKVRTQIITNTAERGNSLTRQSSSTEASPNRTPCAPVPDSLPSAMSPLGHTSSRQGSRGRTGSFNTQHGSPSKMPLRIPTNSEGILTPPGQEDHTQGGCPSVAAPDEPGGNDCRCPPTPVDCPPALQSPGRTQSPSSFETSRTPKLENSGRYPDTSTTRANAVSPEALISPTIEEKVMLCIQENVEKGQVQTKSTSAETKPRPGPSFASWFGFRRSRLPALSSRKTEVPKTKAEKKDTKSLGFGNKQLKSERKKEKKKPELQCEAENEFTRDAELPDHPHGGSQSKNNLKTSQDIYDQMKFEPRSRPSPVTCSAKDTFMTELLNRVDKKAAQQTESGSNNVSCRSVLKGSSQGSCLTGSSVSAQGNHKKNIKTKADVEIPKGSLVKETNENLQEDEEDTIVDSAFQSHIIESNCQMRTLDSGIGTFPLPDAGSRSTGRYLCQADSPEDTEAILSLQPALCAAPSIRAQTLEREVPSSADSQGSAHTTIVHSTSDPIMVARGMQPLQSHLPRPASSGKINSPMQNEAEPRPQTCSSFEYAEDTMERELLQNWGGEDPSGETQKLKQVEETKEDPENRLSKISLESFHKYNSNTMILLEKEKNSLNKAEGRKEEKEKNEETSLSSSDRPGVDNLESLSDSLYDSFSSCASQGSNDA
ncbi:nck-associated protein 5 isoform X6 [Rousettus aegyptiacus]|uniref:nck-associated protein 5 isoform X6 n=1 Tax=Rousettus aegyptiacus TaxID=9407 RepID=UPI00168CC352|nr:nck-associated protein 5 isoform X6 [Rousettus aegyptiacus]